MTMRIYNDEQLADRARDLADAGTDGFNGIKQVFVTLDSAKPPAFTWLDVEFYNEIILAEILDDISDGTDIQQIFTVCGGTRIKADIEANRLQVVEVDRTATFPTRLQLKLNGVGDYSSYTLQVEYQDRIDPLFARQDFKFRPGCFNTNCHPGERYPAAPEEPVIDYLARDFDSFKHLLLNAMRQRVPDWQPTSEADLDQVLIDLLAADADELCDFQDRVMNEAYFGRARKRVSLARHARLMDYHIHQGNQASTTLAVKVLADHSIPAGFGVWPGIHWQDNADGIFISSRDQACFTLLNEIALYTWGNVVTALEAGSTEADIVSSAGVTQTDADDLVAILRRDDIVSLLIEEKLNPETGTLNGRDKTARQLLRLLPGNQAAESRYDPVNASWYVRIRWQEQDRLQHRYCFVVQCPGQPAKSGISAFHGNLLPISHGRPHLSVFRPPGSDLGPTDNEVFVHRDYAYLEVTQWGSLCRLPNALLAYTDTRPGGETVPISTLQVKVSGIGGHWEERIDLIDSESEDMHYMVETDERGFSTLRFGNNINGRALPADHEVNCWYQVSRGSLGNVGADVLTGFDNSASAYPEVERVWNPLDVNNGRDPELPAEILRRAPQAYRARQLRAVTLEDYVRRAEELEGVSHAYARYAWTGSWRTVHVAIDPEGTDVLNDMLRQQVQDYLDAVRLIGEDLEIRSAQYVPLDITLQLCIHPGYWPEDVAAELELEFSDGHTADGRPGFFHPDSWTFGQALHASALIGRALQVVGVERVLQVSMRRWHTGTGNSPVTLNINPDELAQNVVAVLPVKPYEIIQLENDPSQLEKGRIQFDILGGRQ
ncbi:MAG: baseplate J/gp47 family protein [Pseudomonadota bacterium]|nr:baseplate J/gp47 family protein [Pseudomonadota bacterium]